MATKNFELFGGCFGNGIHLANKAVLENGDYKPIGHISRGGRIKFYIKNPESYIPEKDLETIRGWAEENNKDFRARWERLDDLGKWHKMLNEIPYSDLLNNEFSEPLKACNDLHKKVIMLQAVYFRDYV